MNKKKDSKTWGLFKKNSLQQVPLKSLDISIKIVHNVSRVLYTQEFYNDDAVNLEVEFFFPISPEACFDSFEAKFKDTVIKGVVKEKEQAKEEYKQEVALGNTAAYAEINENTGDIMKVMIGNIPPKTEISITYSYIQKLEVSLNKFWCFRLFSCITPRYNGNLSDYVKQDITTLSNYPTISSHNSQAYPWNINVEIQSPNPITFLNSPSHKTTTKYGNEKHTCEMTLDSESKQYPNKDFVLLYSNGKEGESDYVLTPFEDGYCAMVTLLAGQDENVSTDEAYAKFLKSNLDDETPTLDTVRGEYIVLIDRSGSMSGDRIVMARQSLIVFLKSLPKESCFNVVSFGTRHSSLYSSSVQTNQKSLESAIAQIEKFQANLGGTEIYSPLKLIFNTPIKNGYPRFIFLLTDGGVSNTYHVIQLIEENSDRARVFTVGIGNGCSPELITKAALYGKGKHEFVPNPSEIHGKVMSLLNASLSPCYFDFQLEAENFDAIIKSVSPNPVSIPFLLDNQSVTFFLFIREEAFQNGQKMSLKLKYFDSRTKGVKTIGVIIDADKALKNEFISKLALHDMIKRFEAQIETNSEKKNVLWMDKEEIKNALLGLSLEHGILCKATAFFCKIANKDKENEQLEKAHIVVPSIASGDYDGVDQIYMPIARHGNTKAAGCCAEGGGYSGTDKSYDIYPNDESILKSIPKEERTCLEVIIKQNFEGNWDSSDKELGFLILKNGNLIIPPQNSGITSETIWITILVLVWLEVFCKNQKNTWNLIHKKGQEWLKSQGVNYEEVKDLGKPFVKE